MKTEQIAAISPRILTVCAAIWDGSRYVADIARHLNISRAAVRYRLRKAKDLGLVESIDSNHLSLTLKGRRHAAIAIYRSLQGRWSPC